MIKSEIINRYSEVQYLSIKDKFVKLQALLDSFRSLSEAENNNGNLKYQDEQETAVSVLLSCIEDKIALMQSGFKNFKKIKSKVYSLPECEFNDGLTLNTEEAGTLIWILAQIMDTANTPVNLKAVLTLCHNLTKELYKAYGITLDAGV